MTNNFVIVGRLHNILNDGIEVYETYRNEFGEYGKAIVKINTSDTIVQNVKQNCNIDDIVGIKGYIGDGNKLIADKVTFLSSQNNDNL